MSKDYIRRLLYDEIVLEVYRGEWGNGLERQARLEAAGYDYQIVQNKKQHAPHFHSSPQEIASPGNLFHNSLLQDIARIFCP